MYTRGNISDFAMEHIGLMEEPPFSNRIKFNDWYYPETSKYHTTWIDNAPYEIKKDARGRTYYDFGAPDKHYYPDLWPYCATGVSYWYFFGGFPLPKIDSNEGFCSVPNLFKKAKELGWLTDKPLQGDIVILDFKPYGNIDHTGIFLGWEVEGVSFWCMEANTSSGSTGSQSNGGGSFKRLRYVNSGGMRCYFVNVIDNAK